MADIHINVGIVALQRGLLTLEAFAKGVHSLAEARGSHAGLSVRDVWCAPGLLDETQLASVLDSIPPAQGGRDTMLYSPAPEPPKPRDADRDSAQTRIGRSAGKGGSSGAATAPTAASLVPPMPPASALPTPPGGVPVTSAPQFDTVPVRPAPVPFGAAAPAGADTRPRKPTQPRTLAGAPAPQQPAELFDARYKKLAPLGAGGLGEVVACEDLVLGRTVAVKAGHQNGDIDTYSTKVILAREAKIISSLEHPNIIPIYDAGTDKRRGPYYVMRQVTDTSLEVILRRRRMREGDHAEYTLGRLLRYFLQICNAVDYAHHRGVIHCDIKPANILLGDYGQVLLVDWGLAQSKNHPLGVRGGTLGYMAPEQMDPTTERFDERTDVFALGAILYEILTNRAAFPEVASSEVSTMRLDPRALYPQPPSPSQAARDVELAPEIEDICLRAIATNRDERLASARLLANAIDEFIEGSKQKERKRIEADKNADAGDELAERYHEFVESRPEKLTVFRALKADVAPWAALEEKQDLWDAEDIVRVTDALQVRTFQSAVTAYETALDAVPGHGRARRGLARLYMSELQRARRRGDALDEIAYEQLLREVDDGEFMQELQRDGTLELRVGNRLGRVTLSKLVERDRRLVESPVETLAGGGETFVRAMPAGRYVIGARTADDEHPIAWPISLEPGASVQLEIDLLGVRGVGPNEVVVPGGSARLGGDALSTETDEPMIVDVSTFVIQRHPVTFDQWFEFLDWLHASDPAAAARHVPRTTLGVPTWNRAREGRWVADESVPSLVVPPDPIRLPVFGVSAESAEAYAQYLSHKDGKPWRLPTEIEWEKAGRGTDGRVFPWGDHFDATFCKMRDSRPGLPLAEPIGAFAWDVSPYGVCDLAGGVADWCIPDPRRSSPREPREVVSRGGAWCDWPIDCRLASRRRYLATEHSARVGVRLARDP